MPRRSKLDRESKRDAYRVMMPLMFWFLAYISFQMLKGFFGLAPWSQFVAWGFVFILIVIGLCQIPRSVRTIRSL